MQANYHTHTRWCKHGTGEIEDYIEEAIRKGLEEIAITEHVPHKDNLDPRRIQWEEFPSYDQALNEAIKKYEEKIQVIKGFECEYYPEVLDAYEMFREEYGYKLLILGQHRSGSKREIDNFADKSVYEMEVYAEEICKGIESGLFRFAAHPDLALQGYRKGWDAECERIMRKIFSKCEEYAIPVEINANALWDKRAYPSEEAFRISKEYGLKYLINSDAHRPEDLCGAAIKEAEAFAQKLGISVLDYLAIS